MIELISRRHFFIGSLGALAADAKSELEQVDVFRMGDEDYHTYRIPSLLFTKKGTLLAFCEGRRAGSSDAGNIDLVLKRSFDDGKSWSGIQVVADRGEDTIGNPCPVQDRKTGRIWLPLTFNRGSIKERQILDREVEDRRSVWITYSDDDGKTWADLREITATTRKPNWTWYATGPGVGIQTRNGRLIIPCDHAEEGTKAFQSHVIYSDDHGSTWQIGGIADEKTNECQIAELKDGSLLLNMRSYHKRNRRAVVRSNDGGLTWSAVELDDALIEPVCQASLIAHKNTLYFSNPASIKRERMTVRASHDEGHTWTDGKILHDGPAAYSCLAALKKNTLGCLYERGDNQPYERITFARFNSGLVSGR